MVSDSFRPFCWSELFMLRRLRSLTGCAVGIWPTRSPQRRTAADLPVLSADSVSQGPPIQKAIRVNLCKHTRRRSCKKMFRFIQSSQTRAAKQLLEMEVNVCGFNQQHVHQWRSLQPVYRLFMIVWAAFNYFSFTVCVSICVQTSDVFHGPDPSTTGPLNSSWLSLSRSH